MTAVVAGLLIAGSARQAGAQAFGLLLVALGGLWMLVGHLERRGAGSES